MSIDRERLPLFIIKPLFWSTEDQITYKAFTHMGTIEIRPMSDSENWIVSFNFIEPMESVAESVKAAKRVALYVYQSKMMPDLLITSYQALKEIFI